MTTILLVEDERDLARVLTRELEAAGYQVRHAGDGPMAVESHARARPDLVILDWMLPGFDGLEVLRRVRQAAPTPVLMLTARGEETDRVVGLEVGADDRRCPRVRPAAARPVRSRGHARRVAA